MKEIFIKKIYKFNLILFSLYFISFIIVCGPPISPELEQFLLEAIGIIAKEKSEAESLAKLLKSYYPEDSTEYQQGEKYYSEAKAEFDSWIEIFKSILQSEYEIKESDPIIESLRESLREAAEKSHRFKKYVKDLIPPIIEEPRPLAEPPIGVDAILKIFDSIYDAILKIWDIYKKENEEKRKNIIKTIEGQKWKNFDEI